MNVFTEPLGDQSRTLPTVSPGPAQREEPGSRERDHECGSTVHAGYLGIANPADGSEVSAMKSFPALVQAA